MIRVEGLTKSFGDNHVLRGVDFEAPKGSITIIIGRSGGGKSVFLKHLIGLMRPDAGRVFIQDTDITQLSGRALEPVCRRCKTRAERTRRVREAAIVRTAASSLSPGSRAVR